jgi:transposase-like protein
MVCLWRAVDAEGEVLDVLVQAKRNKHAALKLMRKLLKKYGFLPDTLVTDDLRSYHAAAAAGWRHSSDSSAPRRDHLADYRGQHIGPRVANR